MPWIRTLPAGPLPVEQDPVWEYLISHHLPARFGRTLHFRAGAHIYHLCARCSGQLLGALAWLGIYLTALPFRTSVFEPWIQGLLAVFPLLAAWDWITQSVGRRESSNPLRVISGALLGFAAADLLGAMALGQWKVLLGGLLVSGAYLLILLAILRVTGAWRQLLTERFPGIDLGHETPVE
ncbi:MAG: DUF2085 domain-containing protein [Thermoplasmata archaeon]